MKPHVVVLCVLWVVWMGAAFASHVSIKDAKVKRRWHPWFIAGAVAFFAACCWTAGVPAEAWSFIVPVLAVLGLVMARNVAFCDACGTTLYRQYVMGRMNYCPVCGAKLPIGKP
jgi:hypothetical protein